MSKDFEITIHGPRAEDSIAICGTATFYVRSPIPQLIEIAVLEGHPDTPGILRPYFHRTERVYLIDVENMPTDVIAKMKAAMSTRFNVPLEEIIDIPVLEADCSLMIRNPLKWIM